MASATAVGVRAGGCGRPRGRRRGRDCSDECQSLAYLPSRSLLFAGTDSGVEVFKVASSGALSKVSGSPFGGNPIACRAALATIETIEADGLLARAERIGARFRQRLEALRARMGLRKPMGRDSCPSWPLG